MSHGLLVAGVEQPMGLRPLRVESLEAPPGGVVALVGPNGAGKTTLLRLLAGLERPAAGRVEWNGVAISPRVATLVAQRPYLLGGDLLRNAAFGLRARGLGRAQASHLAREALARWGLGGLERRRAGVLSGGEAQRLALARACVLATPVLLLDEPYAALDAEGAALVDRLLAAGPGATRIWATPDRGAAERRADLVWVIEDGVARTERSHRG